VTDFVEVTVKINANGEEAILTDRREFRVGQFVTIETPAFAANVGARAALLHQLGPVQEPPR